MGIQGVTYLGVLVLIQGAALSWVPGEGAVVPEAGADAKQPVSDIANSSLSRVVREYSEELELLASGGSAMPDAEMNEWIERIQVAMDGSTDFRVRQTANVILISLYNALGQWELSEDVCLQAINEAPDLLVRFERLADLYTIRASQRNSAGAIEGDELLERTFEELNARFEEVRKIVGIGSLTPDAWNMYRWAAEHQVRLAVDNGNDEMIAARAASLLRTFADRGLSADMEPSHAAVTHYRAVGAAAALRRGDVEKAQEVLAMVPRVDSGMHDALIAYDLASAVDFEILNVFVSELDWNENGLESLELSLRHAVQGIQYLVELNGSLRISEADGPIENQDVLFAFMLLEDMVDEQLNQDHIPGTSTRERTVRKATLIQSIRILVDFLRVDGQSEAADLYADILHARFSDQSRLD